MYPIGHPVSSRASVSDCVGESCTGKGSLGWSAEAVAFAGMGSLPTAVDNMTPGTRFIKTLAALPVAPGVAAHSIIAVDGDGPVEDGNDGIVE